MYYLLILYKVARSGTFPSSQFHTVGTLQSPMYSMSVEHPVETHIDTRGTCISHICHTVESQPARTGFPVLTVEPPWNWCNCSSLTHPLLFWRRLSKNRSILLRLHNSSFSSLFSAMTNQFQQTFEYIYNLIMRLKFHFLLVNTPHSCKSLSFWKEDSLCPNYAPVTYKCVTSMAARSS